MIESVILSKIHLLRGFKVMLDEDLSELYDVSTKRLNEQVKRNLDRFPDDFMFQLTESELEILKSQNATSSWGGRRTLPFAFTEHGILMLSSVLRSKEAIAVNIRIMRLFTRMRKLLMEQSELVLKLHRIEDAVENHNSEIQILYEHLRRLLEVTKKEIKQKQRKMIGY